jgi:capsular polysaccharide transport system permease protein
LRRRLLSAALVASLLAAVYWLAIAPDRYVSETHVIIQRIDVGGGQKPDVLSLLGGAGGHSDQMLLRDHLMSVDMLKKLDASLNLRAHYSDPKLDFFSRMSSPSLPIEDFHRYFLSHVSIEFDDYAGVLVIKAQGYDPKTAHAIATKLVEEGERFMNGMAHGLAQDQVAFLEKEVAQINDRAMQARQAVLAYQNKKGLVSPQATAEAVVAIVAKLEGLHTDLQTQRTVLQSYLVAGHPSIVQINQQLDAVDQQITQEKAKLASPNGKTLNSAVEEFQRLEMQAVFVQDVYKTALEALERGRFEAARTLKKVSVIQAPTLPEYALEPRRFYNTLVFTLVAFLLAGVMHLLAAIVRDHKD